MSRWPCGVDSDQRCDGGGSAGGNGKRRGRVLARCEAYGRPKATNVRSATSLASAAAVPAPGMKAIDSRAEQGFLTAGAPGHRAERNAFMNPATVIAGERRIGQRPQQKSRRFRRLRDQAGRLEREFRAHDSADQPGGEFVGVHLTQPGQQLRREFLVDRAGGQLVCKHLVAHLPSSQDIGEQVVHLQHVNTALLHSADEGVVVVLRLRDPQYVIE